MGKPHHLLPVQTAFDFANEHPVEVSTPAAPDKRPEPIPYTLVVSRRARQVYLRVEQGRGLLVTIPKRFARRDVPAIIEEQRAWVESALAELEQRIPAEFRQWPPTQLRLSAVNRMVDIAYVGPASAAGVASAQWVNGHRLELCVEPEDREQVARVLAAALKALARQELEPWLARLAARHKLRYKKLTVRGQRTLWGSYSSSGTLSLNYKLLFLSPELAEYVMLHELAHTRHLDHSPAFWALLEGLRPGARALDDGLPAASAGVPPWLELAH